MMFILQVVNQIVAQMSIFQVEVFIRWIERKAAASGISTKKISYPPLPGLITKVAVNRDYWSTLADNPHKHRLPDNPR